MPRFSFNRKRAKLRQLLGIRARLALLAVILVAPLMLDRARSLEETRAKQIALASAEFASLARHSADTQREVISSVETVLKSAAYIRASVGGISKSCDILRASLPTNLPWIRNLLIAGGDGRIQCSTNNMFVGLDLSDRAYFRKAQSSREFVLSDLLFERSTQDPSVMAAYPVSAINRDAHAVILASIDLEWMSKVMNNFADRPGAFGALIDSAGVVLAAPPNQASIVGKSLDTLPLLSAVVEKALNSRQDDGSLSFVGAGGSRRALSFARVAGTNARLIASIDEDKVTEAINLEIRTAYLQFGLVSLVLLIGAFLAAEALIIQPIRILASMAKRFGQGDRSARAEGSRLPAEFRPLARAFNAMAARLSQRERELIDTNDRLTVIASVDMLSGLANRRGFQSRLDFEWMKAQQLGRELALLMIDVDHFKLYNDTYGHPEGDTCLTRVGETLSGIATQSTGFAARYGGEEFCLLLPNTGPARARKIAEMVRSAIEDLAMTHRASGYRHVTVSIGLASTCPNDDARPSDLVEAADAALYAAKHRGRNLVVEHGFARISDALGEAERGSDPAASLRSS